MCFFSPSEIGRTKTTDYTFEEKIGVLFRFNAGNDFYELKKKKVYLLQLSPRALNDHENTGSMSKDPGPPLFSLLVKDKFQILVECNSGVLGCIRVCVKSHYWISVLYVLWIYFL